MSTPAATTGAGAAPEPRETLDLDTLTADFEIATTKLLRRRELLKRIDTKFLLDRATLAAVLEGLGKHYGLLVAGDRRLATYRTLYFDDAERRFFHDHRRGRRPRQKVRIRHYDDRSVSFAEVKTKRSEVLTVKHRRPIDYNSEDLGGDVAEMLAERCSVAASELRPQLWTNFKRLTLIGIDSVERVTADIELEFARSTERRDAGDAVILEIKQWPPTTHTPIWRALRAQNVRPMSLSKYCAATVLLEDLRIRHNRLRPSLRAMASVGRRGLRAGR